MQRARSLVLVICAVTAALLAAPSLTRAAGSQSPGHQLNASRGRAFDAHVARTPARSSRQAAFMRVLSNTPKHDRSAKLLAQSYAATVKDLPRQGKLPTATAVAVDQRTGRAYWGNSGKPHATKFAQELLRRMPEKSLEPWTVDNCAEFRAVNAALLQGASMKDLEVHTVRTATGMAFPRCRNCVITTGGVGSVTSD